MTAWRSSNGFLMLIRIFCYLVFNTSRIFPASCLMVKGLDLKADFASIENCIDSAVNSPLVQATQSGPPALL